MDFWDSNFGIFLIILAKCLAVTVGVLVSLAFLMYADRKVWAAVMMRRGPNVVGVFGIMQSFADFLKYIVKEVVVPAGADKPVFFLAPMIAFVLAVISWAVIPFDNGWVVANLNIGILYIFAISSLEVYGVIMGGWASNSKYPFLGSLRSAAQMERETGLAPVASIPVLETKPRGRGLWGIMRAWRRLLPQKLARR